MSRLQAVNVALEAIGIDSDRFAIQWCSSAEAPRFAELVSEFTEKVRMLGPNPLRLEKAATA